MSTTSCYTLTNTSTSTITPTFTIKSPSSPTTATTMHSSLSTLRGTLTTLHASLLTTIESNPLALMVLQYLTAASRAATIYLVSVIWTLAQSMMWMVTAEGLDWIQSQSFGPLILEWDSFLFGAVFLTIEIHPDSIEHHHAKRCCGWGSVKGHSRNNSRASSLSTSNSSGRRVTFDEQVMVLGSASGARGVVTPILVNSSNSYYYSSSSSASYSAFSQDPHAPILTESPTRSTFAPAPCPSSLQEAEYLQRNFGYGYQFIDSPSSSRSNSCRSSICSVSSSSSSESNDRESAKPTASMKSNSSSRLAALFHHSSSSRHTTTTTTFSPTSSSSSSIDLSTQPSSGTSTDKKSKNLVHRIMHPHQHKRELEHQHQLQLQLQQLQQLQQQQQQQPQQQQQMRQYPQPYHIPEFLDAMTSSSLASMMEHEYQPSEHTRKTLKQRLGLKKKSLST
ncbi:hypothetical protein BGZ95_008346 [Linnemannia exigua]|uniref:Uncharacterized protein n=1 Tax=Linnemannia exigua TaxID=604196 RepID=A0AAD4DE85_9FUNG|nr:hypothetical protein BGZ95_008346 [Linnemannia exigua]